MTNKEAIESLKWQVEYSKEIGESHVDGVYVDALALAVKALENQPFDVDEYRRRLVDKYSDGDEATDVDNGITIALDLLDEMEEEQS